MAVAADAWLQTRYATRLLGQRALKIAAITDKGLGSKVDTEASGKYRAVSRCSSVIADGKFTAKSYVKGNAGATVKKLQKDQAKLLEKISAAGARGSELIKKTRNRQKHTRQQKKLSELTDRLEADKATAPAPLGLNLTLHQTESHRFSR